MLVSSTFESGWVLSFVQVADEGLAELAARGDAGAFGELVERHQRYVFNLCLRMVGDYDLAAEMAQEVFLRAWRSLRSFRSESKFTTWLYTVAHNLCMNRLASRQREERHRVAEGEAEEDMRRLRSPVEEPAATYERREQESWVHRQIEQLPPRYRMVITLFYLQELSYQEIAEVMGLPVGTVKTHLFPAKVMLRRAMEDGVSRENAATSAVR